jgi:rubrerythrin
MYEEEVSHFTRLKALFHQRFGGHLPLARRARRQGIPQAKTDLAGVDAQPRKVLSTILNMEAESRRFHQDVMNKVTLADIRKLLDELAGAEEDHQDLLVHKTKGEEENRCAFLQNDSR